MCRRMCRLMCWLMCMHMCRLMCMCMCRLMCRGSCVGACVGSCVGSCVGACIGWCDVDGDIFDHIYCICCICCVHHKTICAFKAFIFGDSVWLTGGNSAEVKIIIEGESWGSPTLCGLCKCYPIMQYMQWSISLAWVSSISYGSRPPLSMVLFHHPCNQLGASFNILLFIMQVLIQRLYGNICIWQWALTNIVRSKWF